MQDSKPDSRVFASYPMPAKIDLLNERPRRESLVEQQLENRIGQISPVAPRLMVNEQVIKTTTVNNTLATSGFQQPSDNWAPARSGDASNYQQTITESCSPTPRGELKETRIMINRHSSPIGSISAGVNKRTEQITETTITQQEQAHNNIVSRPQNYLNQSRQFERPTTTATTSINKEILTNELAEKEAKLMREIEALNQRPYSPYQTPGKIDISNQQKISATQQHHQYNVSPRPHSSASSTGADLLEKEARLLKEIEEIESKPFNSQTMVVEREEWYEYPESRPNSRHLTDSRRRVRDFCSMPAELCQDRHVHEENLPIQKQRSPTPGSIHTTIIRSPKRDIDNKSPLPFAFDNFTTKGVRGNIATAGAVEPDRPRAPIFPIVKRTPSPATLRN